MSEGGALESEVVRLLDIFEICDVSGLCQLVKFDDVIVGIFAEEAAYVVQPNESGTSGYQYIVFYHYL